MPESKQHVKASLLSSSSISSSPPHPLSSLSSLPGGVLVICDSDSINLPLPLLTFLSPLLATIMEDVEGSHTPLPLPFLPSSLHLLSYISSLLATPVPEEEMEELKKVLNPILAT